jgi:hypothetical protein
MNELQYSKLVIVLSHELVIHPPPSGASAIVHKAGAEAAEDQLR